MPIPYKQSHRLHGHTDSVVALAFTPDGSRLASAACDGRVIVWSTKEGKAIYEVAMQNMRFTCVAWLNNTLAIAGTENGDLVIIEIANVCVCVCFASMVEILHDHLPGFFCRIRFQLQVIVCIPFLSNILHCVLERWLLGQNRRCASSLSPESVSSSTFGHDHIDLRYGSGKKKTILSIAGCLSPLCLTVMKGPWLWPRCIGQIK